MKKIMRAVTTPPPESLRKIKATGVSEGLKYGQNCRRGRESGTPSGCFLQMRLLVGGHKAVKLISWRWWAMNPKPNTEPCISETPGQKTKTMGNPIHWRAVFLLTTTTSFL